ncbi:MAG: hypothetical protein II255_02295, partial [Ruminiclostridium sp.]|nr:hypothetical protein [Ruminiclostridium sp.]
MKKRLLAMIMTLAMCLSLLPTAAFATVPAETGEPTGGETTEASNPLQPAPKYYYFNENDATENNYDIKLSKTAVDKGNGKFEVTLSAEANSVV